MQMFCSLLLSFWTGLFAQVAPEPAALERSPYEFPFATHQAWVEAMAGKGLQDWSTVFDAAAYERYRKGEGVTAERIQYRSDDLKINGFLIQPKDTSKRYPLIVFNRGGTLQWSRITFWEILEFCRLAERGYVVAASYFRGCGGSEGTDSLGQGDVRDVKQMIALLSDLPHVDGTRLGMWGFSRGSMTTFRYIAQHPGVKAVATVGGVSDTLRSHRHDEFDTHVYPKALPGYTEDKDAALKSVSAAYWVETLPQIPMLFMHGAADKRVLPEQSILLAEKLQALDRPYRLIVFENGSHSLLEHVSLVRAQLDDWFDRYVKDPANKP